MSELGSYERMTTRQKRDFLWDIQHPPKSETAELARAKVLLRRVYEVLPVGTYHDADLYSDITDFLEIEPPQ